jgi:hypothetical protein
LRKVTGLVRRIVAPALGLKTTRTGTVSLPRLFRRALPARESLTVM